MSKGVIVGNEVKKSWGNQTLQGFVGHWKSFTLSKMKRH